MEQGLKEILDLMNGPTEKEKDFITRAYHFAAEAHKDLKRFSGEPYLVHLVETAKGLAGLGMSPITIAAGLLHDCIEDAGVKPEVLEEKFCKELVFLVEGVTKLGHFKYRGAERHRESLRKLLVATGKDARVLIIKLMDRLHNIRTLKYVPKEKQQRIALETLEIYAAIAHRLGMGLVRRELEDGAFEYAYPEEFQQAKKLLTERTKEADVRLEKMSRALKTSLVENGITKFHIDYRVKGLWSLWQKLKRKGGDIDSIYDISALRVIVPDLTDCYRTLGIAHALWQPLPNKIKDYIAFPKPNGYQGLHTTVFTGDGGVVEIQIRTEAMHQEAQYGIAAHVLYKEGASVSTEDDGAQFNRKVAPPPTNRGSSSFEWIRSLIPSFRSDVSETPPSTEIATTDKEQTPTVANETDTAAPPASTPQKSKPKIRRARYIPAETPEWLSDLEGETNNPDFETTIKTDVFTHRIFVFTPKGDAVDLPLNSSPIDFAYAIHSNIGEHTAGAKINGKMVSLDSTLKNGDIVEIQTKKTAYPKQKWLGFVKTALARRHIRNALEREKKNS